MSINTTNNQIGISDINFTVHITNRLHNTINNARPSTA